MYSWELNLDVTFSLICFDGLKATSLHVKNVLCVSSEKTSQTMCGFIFNSAGRRVVNMSQKILTYERGRKSDWSIERAMPFEMKIPEAKTAAILARTRYVAI